MINIVNININILNSCTVKLNIWNVCNFYDWDQFQ